MNETSKHLLIVEDHDELWDFLSRRLARRVFELSIAKDCQEGLDLARQQLPSIILLDMNLPKVDGWTVASTLKADPTTAVSPSSL